VEGLDKLGKLAKGEPVNGGSSAVFDLRVRFFFNGGDDDVKTLGSCGIKDEEREASVTGDQA
jgi:hypothetical protein